MILKKYLWFFCIAQIFFIPPPCFAQYYNSGAATTNTSSNSSTNNPNNPSPTPNNPGAASTTSNQINSDTQIKDLFNQADYQHLSDPESDAQQLQIGDQP